MEKRIRVGNSSVVRILSDGCSLKASSLLGSLAGRKFAFTMAEILLSLTIIGVVAAITLPSLTGNINERTWNTQRKALHARLSQAISLMNGMRGYGDITLVTPPDEYGMGAVYSSTNATEVFLSAGLSKVYKLNNICDASHISDCGMPSEVINMVGSKLQISNYSTLEDYNAGYTQINCGGGAYAMHASTAAFETANGESVLAFYNPACFQNFEIALKGTTGFSTTSTACLNMIYDLNGKKGPNTVSKDVGFITVFYGSDSVVVAPMPASKNASDRVGNRDSASGICSQQSDDLRLPSLEELSSMGINYKLIDASAFEQNCFVSSTHSRSSRYLQGYSPALLQVCRYSDDTTFVGIGNSDVANAAVRCIKR